MKTSPDDVTVLLVGGGGIIVPDKLTGVEEIVRPPYFDVANAVGAAMAKGEHASARNVPMTLTPPSSRRRGRHHRDPPGPFYR